MAKYMANEASDDERLVMDSLLQESKELKNTFQQLIPYYQTRESSDLKDPKGGL